MSLEAASRGYEYQDLLSAARLVDLTLGLLVRAVVDKKAGKGDRFDDLTVVDDHGRRERIQVKHTDNDNRPLTLATFTGDTRGLRLDKLVASAVADRDGAGDDGQRLAFRVVMRDGRPEDSALLTVLQEARPDPGPLLAGMATHRMRFDADVLWPPTCSDAGDQTVSDDPFSFVRDSTDRADLVWLCQRLIIEVEAPSSSADLTSPGPAEHLLLDRVRSEIGAGQYPNTDRSPLDVAEAFIRTVRMARQGRVEVTADELMRRSRLRRDFGAVAKAHPVDRGVEVSRHGTIDALVTSVAAASETGVPLLLTGPPGQGKSWMCQQLIERMEASRWLIAEHYCYLGDADESRTARVHAETIFGSLLGRLAAVDPTLVEGQRPRFAANHEALESAVRRARDATPGRPVALIIDGLDHVTRVAPGPRGSDPSRTVAEELAALNLPSGSVLIVLSQPGDHLQPLYEAKAVSASVPAMTRSEVTLLAQRWRVIVPALGLEGEHLPSADDATEADDFIDALTERSTGNALYATYLCREILSRRENLTNPAAAIRELPPFDETLAGYYEHVYQSLGPESGWVADLLALLDFSVTRTELREIWPTAGHRVDRALKLLGPVLAERAAQGGIRVYHESFARFLRRQFQSDPAAMTALLEDVVAWLRSKGFLQEERSFRFLLPMLASVGHDHEAVALVDHTFLAKAIAMAYPASAIVKNIITAIGCAARAEDWPAVVRCVELARGAATYEQERYDNVLPGFVDVPMSVLNPDVFASRLLYEGQPVVSGRAGLRLCAAVDARGAAAPWREYMTAYHREKSSENTAWGRESEQDVEVAWLRGRLRLAATATRTPSDSRKQPNDAVPPIASSASVKGDVHEGNEAIAELADPINVRRLARYLDQCDLPVTAVVDALVDTRGTTGTADILNQMRNPGPFELALAARLNASANAPGGNARQWALSATAHGVSTGSAHLLLDFGVPIDSVCTEQIEAHRDRLLALTRQMQVRSVRWESGLAGQWMDACAIAARRDPVGLNTAEALVSGPGWYPCWLKFVIALVQAETGPPNQRASSALAAFRLLTGDLNPFAGDPRACDLYPIQAQIEDTIRRAAMLVDDERWPDALRIMEEVSEAITTTIRGEFGGPFAGDSLLALAIKASTSPARFPATQNLIERTMEHDAAGRFYADLASYRLAAARFAEHTGNTTEATKSWTDACRMLSAYGFHKDITIYELLDPLEDLITASPGQSRHRVAALQPLCERIPAHTDGKETRFAPTRWWQLLAQADPSALAQIAGTSLASRCNLPNNLLHDARRYLWQTWHRHADPIVAGLLRLSLETPLHPDDADALQRLIDEADRPALLPMLLLCQAEERPSRYPTSDSRSLLDSDTRQIAKINSVAEQDVAPRLLPIPSDSGETHQPADSHRRSRPQPLSQQIADQPPRMFPDESAGVAQATRAWRSRPYDTTEPEWSAARFANIIGYRLIGLAAVGRESDAEAGLRAAADAADFGDEAELLTALADGLERHQQPRLAAIAHTLAWTRARAGGGWRQFGGRNRIQSLRQAASLDAATTRSVLADEVQRAISDRRGGGYGITHALIYAFTVVGDLAHHGPSVDVAFACWDQAALVIAERSPYVHPHDDPDEPYNVPDPDPGTDIVGDLNAAMGTATLAGVAAPGRENKRRSLLAVKLLIDSHPDSAATAFGTLLPVFTDPGTLTWLLTLLYEAEEKATPVVDRCRGTITLLAQSTHLTVRTLARDLLGTDNLPDLPIVQPDTALLASSTPRLWTPDGEIEETDEDDEPLTGALQENAGARLHTAEELLPGLFEATRQRLADAVASEGYQQRIHAQLSALKGREPGPDPDAYLAIDEAVEDALQRAASGGRAACLANGQPVDDPIEWESQLAEAILDGPFWALTIEATRQPRPVLPAPPGSGDPVWETIRRYASGTSHHESQPVESGLEHDGVLFGTLSIGSPEDVDTVEGGPFDGWRLVASAEHRTVLPTLRRETVLTARRYRALELLVSTREEKVLNLRPFEVADHRAWTMQADPVAGPSLPSARTALFGVDTNGRAFGDSRFGLGIHLPLLTPAYALLVALRLEPTEPFLLQDGHGPALAAITWRTNYDRSEYRQARPTLRGTAILLRPDLYQRLTEQGAGRLAFRDFVAGSAALAARP